MNSFIDLNDLALAQFPPEERRRIGVHTCPGGDLDSTHSADVDYEELLPSLFAPFADDTSTSRDTALARIRARVLGTALAEEALGWP